MRLNGRRYAVGNRHSGPLREAALAGVNGPRYWVGVASRDHVARGVEAGVAQLGHGKPTSLQRMRPGDWLVYYSPRITFEGRDPCQAFTAVGRIAEGDVYRVTMNERFMPFRRKVEYVSCGEAPIQPLVERLSFIPDKRRWGYSVRRGHFEVSAADFRLIASAMGVDIEHS